ncbi:hypothetical protein [Streptomyces fuscigenes]|uniref:hypothetical protein n=1 Tax=Streptomyces fuscigenes TaxID=1528880 RepID=UPI003557E0DF
MADHVTDGQKEPLAGVDGLVEVAADLRRRGRGQVAQGEFDAQRIRKGGGQEGALQGQGEFVFLPEAFYDIFVLDAEFGVHGHDAGIGLRQFLVQSFEFVALGVGFLERGDQVAGLCLQVVDRAGRTGGFEECTDRFGFQVLGGEWGNRADDLDQAAGVLRGADGGRLVSGLRQQPADGRERLGAGSPVIVPAQHRVERGGFLGQAEDRGHHLRAQQVAAQFAQSGGQAYVVPTLQANRVGDGLGVPAKGEHIALGPDRSDQHGRADAGIGGGRDHCADWATTALASSRRVAARRIRPVAITAGGWCSRPARSVALQRSVSPSECITSMPQVGRRYSWARVVAKRQERQRVMAALSSLQACGAPALGGTAALVTMPARWGLFNQYA